jgi:hypothetical protein
LAILDQVRHRRRPTVRRRRVKDKARDRAKAKVKVVAIDAAAVAAVVAAKAAKAARAVNLETRIGPSTHRSRRQPRKRPVTRAP